MNIYHPSNKKFDIVKVKYFGSHFYTQNDLRASNIKRSFWYLKSNIPERRLTNTHYLYEAKIDKNDIYDLRKDAENLKGRHRNIDTLLKALRQRFKAVIYNLGAYNVVAVFIDLKPTKITERRLK